MKLTIGIADFVFPTSAAYSLSFVLRTLSNWCGLRGTRKLRYAVRVAYAMGCICLVCGMLFIVWSSSTCLDFLGPQLAFMASLLLSLSLLNTPIMHGSTTATTPVPGLRHVSLDLYLNLDVSMIEPMDVHKIYDEQHVLTSGEVTCYAIT